MIDNSRQWIITDDGKYHLMENSIQWKLVIIKYENNVCRMSTTLLLLVKFNYTIVFSCSNPADCVSYNGLPFISSLYDDILLIHSNKMYSSKITFLLSATLLIISLDCKMARRNVKQRR